MGGRRSRGRGELAGVVLLLATGCRQPSSALPEPSKREHLAAQEALSNQLGCGHPLALLREVHRLRGMDAEERRSTIGSIVMAGGPGGPPPTKRRVDPLALGPGSRSLTDYWPDQLGHLLLAATFESKDVASPSTTCETGFEKTHVALLAPFPRWPTFEVGGILIDATCSRVEESVPGSMEGMTGTSTLGRPFEEFLTWATDHGQPVNDALVPADDPFEAADRAFAAWEEDRGLLTRFGKGTVEALEAATSCQVMRLVFESFVDSDDARWTALLDGDPRVDRWILWGRFEAFGGRGRMRWSEREERYVFAP
jgi:hypothetical protein